MQRRRFSVILRCYMETMRREFNVGKLLKAQSLQGTLKHVLNKQYMWYTSMITTHLYMCLPQTAAWNVILESQKIVQQESQAAEELSMEYLSTPEVLLQLRGETPNY
jgi:uncharacterized damage-inducible protein DinB